MAVFDHIEPVKEINCYNECEMVIAPTKLFEAVDNIIADILAKFAGLLLSETYGYRQTDDTYAIYHSVYQDLMEMSRRQLSPEWRDFIYFETLRIVKQAVVFLEEKPIV